MSLEDQLPDEQMRELLDRYEQLREQGTTFTLEDLCRDYPGRLEELRRRVRDRELSEAHRPPPDERPEVPGYEILGEIGRGGFGVVYKARQEGLNRVVALKMILAGAHADADLRLRFLREAEAVARLQHANVVQIFEVGSHEGHAFLALEYVEGPTLAAHCDNRPQDPRWAAEVAEVLARAVHHVHEKGIIHRDLKPGNVMLSGGRVPKVMDFGLARHVEVGVGQTLTGAVMGTPNFMAPEQASGRSKEVGPAADVWALGAILYELLTGRPPFLGPTAFDTLQAVVHQEPVSPRQFQPAVPRDLETVCHRCLQKDPGKRYHSAAALADDLRRFLNGEPIAARPVGALERGRRWCQRNPAVAALLGAVAALLLLGTTAASALAVWALGEKDNAGAALGRETSAKQALEGALGREKDAKQQAQEREKDAREALAKEQKALAELEAWHSQLARSFSDISNREFHRGYAGDSLNWMLRAYEVAPREDPLRDSYRSMVAAQARDVERRLPHDQKVNVVAFSPDGRLALTAGGDAAPPGEVRLWEAATGKPLLTFHPPGGVNAAAFSPDGKLVLTGEGVTERGLGEARLWDASTGKPLGEPLPFEGNVSAVAFSPDGKLALVGGWDKEARLWEVPAGKLVAELPHEDWVNAVAFSPDGELAVTGSGSPGGKAGEARLWDLAARKLVAALPHKGAVHAVAFSPDGKLVLTGSDDHTARVWDAVTGKPLGEPLEHEEGVLAVAFRPGGGYVLTGSTDKTARLWEVATGKEVASRAHKGEVGAVAFSPDGKLVLSGAGALGGEGEVQLWDVTTGERFVLRHESPVQAAAFSPDGRRVLSGGGHVLQSRGEARLWEIPLSRQLGAFRHDKLVRAVAFSPDGRQVLTAGEDKKARLWDVASGEELATLPHEEQVRAVAFSPDGKFAVTGGGSEKGAGEAWLWDLATRKTLGEEPLRHDRVVNAVAFSPDGRLVLTGSDDQTARLWEVATGKQVASLRHEGKVNAVAFSPDGRLALTGAGLEGKDGGEARLWEVATGKPLGEPLRHEGSVDAVAFRPDGRVVLTGGFDRTARLWDVATGKEIANFPHKREVNAVAFSPDGRLVLVGGASLQAVGGVREEVQMWEAATGKVIGVFQRQGWVHSVAFSPDGRLALTGGSSRELFGGGEARLWDVFVPLPPDEPDRLRAWVEVRTGKAFDEGGVLRDLSPDEWLRRWQKLEAGGGDWQPPADPRRWRLAQVNEAEAQKDWFAARVHLDRLLKDEPDNDALLLRRGQAHWNLGQWAEAVADCGKVLDRDPDNVLARMHRGTASAALREWERAVADLRHVHRSVPENVDVAYLVGLALLGARDLKGYEEHGREMLDRFGKTTEARQAQEVAGLLVLRPWPEKESAGALRLARLAAEAAPKSSEAREILGAAYYRAAQDAEAVAELDRAVKGHDEGGAVATRLFLAMAHHRLGHADEARQWLAKAHEQIDADASPRWIERLRRELLLAEAEESLRKDRPE